MSEVIFSVYNGEDNVLVMCVCVCVRRDGQHAFGRECRAQLSHIKVVYLISELCHQVQNITALAVTGPFNTVFVITHLSRACRSPALRREEFVLTLRWRMQFYSRLRSSRMQSRVSASPPLFCYEVSIGINVDKVDINSSDLL